MTEATVMVKSIIDLANEEAEEIRRAAAAKAEQIRRDAQARGEARAREIIARAERRAEMEERRIATKAELETRRELLGAKVALLDEVFAAAYRELADLPEADWRRFMHKLLVEAAVDGAETVAVPAGQADKFAGLLAGVNKELKAAGKRGELKPAAEPAAIEAGFILESRDYTVDCSLRTLLAERRAELEPEVAGVLFA